MRRETLPRDYDDDTATLDLEFPSVRYLGMRRRLLIGVAALLFVSGTICGAASMRLYTSYRPVAPPNGYAEGIGARIQREHGVSEATRQQIEQIVRDHQPRLHGIRESTIAPMRAELLQMINRIAAALPPQEAERYRTGALRRLDAAYPDGSGSDKASHDESSAEGDMPAENSASTPTE